LRDADGPTPPRKPVAEHEQRPIGFFATCHARMTPCTASRPLISRLR
jgi:hypothetical protein